MQFHFHVFLFFATLIYACGFKSKIIQKSLLLPSKNPAKYNIIFFPGYDKKPYSYKNLCDKINERLDDSVNFLVLDYDFKTPFFLERHCNEITVECLMHLKSLNKDAEKTYLMGHSAGGYYAIEPAEKYCDGLIQLGCTLNSRGKLPWKETSLQKYRKPVLTLLGEKDGYFSYLNSIQEYYDLFKNERPRKPIVIEKDVNHLQMCDNIESNMAKFIQKKDCPSPLTLEQAHDKLSFTIAGFINNDTFIHYKNNQSMAKINQYKQLADSVNNVSIRTQYCVICPKKSTLLPIQNTIHSDLREFISSKPKIHDDGLISTHSYVQKTFKNNLYSPSLWIKTKNQEAIKIHPKYQYLETKSETSAAGLNRKIFKKYFTGKNSTFVFFEHDTVYDNVLSSARWITDEISVVYNEKNETLHIRSPVLYSGNKYIPRYAGMKYMKLLTPQMVKEIESLYF